MLITYASHNVFLMIVVMLIAMCILVIALYDMDLNLKIDLFTDVETGDQTRGKVAFLDVYMLCFGCICLLQGQLSRRRYNW